MEKFFVYLLGTIAAAVTLAAIMAIFRGEKKYNTYLRELRQMADALRVSNREIRELHFRDTSGKLQVVRIIIDYGITDEMAESIEGDWFRSNTPVPTDISDFVFSPKALHGMRANGIEPEDVVRDMLIASGRMRK